ncbi:MAG: sigma-70 family RNA polymerase sigma factor [Desulfobacteraceae bacterium]|nr:sigma-70 family RNA polymerase sigma factor [Desulfobacteraceae bacterium]
MQQELEKCHPNVKKTAWRYYNRIKDKYGSFLEVGDLYHEGLVALYDCSDRFDASMGKEFWSFACRRVEGAMKDFLRRSPKVRLPQKLRENLDKVSNTRTYLSRRLSREPAYEEIATYLGVSINEIHDWEKLNFIYKEEEDLKDNALSPSHISERQQLYDAVYECLENLPEKEKQILIKRNKYNIPLRELADKHNVSIETVRRWEKTGKEKMKKCLKRKDWSVEDI